MNKGICFGEMGKYKESMECFDKAIENSPEDFRILKEKGIVLHKAGKYEEAIETYNRAFSFLNPGT